MDFLSFLHLGKNKNICLNLGELFTLLFEITLSPIGYLKKKKNQSAFTRR